MRIKIIRFGYNIKHGGGGGDEYIICCAFVEGVHRGKRGPEVVFVNIKDGYLCTP